METVIQTRNLHKIFKTGEVSVHALKGLDLEVPEGQFVVILGPSGSGKSTLLNILGGMDTPTEGEFKYRGTPLQKMNKHELTMFRRKAVGFIFQFYNLMPNLTALENVALATELTDTPLDPGEVLAEIGLADREDHFPSQLSGGQQQRVAIARAIAKNPDILLCDEPTGALDYETGKQVLNYLQKINRERGKTLLVITHNAAIGKMADRVVNIRDGRIDRIEENSSPVTADEVSW
ncbi:ABC transporter ATP-binding protein [Phosphitispora fastidiosa]|uniref:ABC transporter ATP-binding protein n=1 Tax=Phosphitispora fastidiosa TaxID=2837202 RepID=UPI001E4B26FD|nr:ABC transporter ATP-binding protein [Phosphitispora fastidiosa]MBU7008335.1 putative ABC transport system ATP-binding protein [Phosphitispora fastidiosa]